MKRELANFEDIVLFVDNFYNKVQSDELIGPIFNAVIIDWGPHLQKRSGMLRFLVFRVSAAILLPDMHRSAFSDRILNAGCTCLMKPSIRFLKEQWLTIQKGAQM